MNRPTEMRRVGATAVETAVVIGVALMFLFGIVEYGRFLAVLHGAHHAARVGARYAAVHTGDGTVLGNMSDTPTFDTANPYSPGSYLAPATSIRAVVNHQMGSLRNSISGYTVNALNVDPATGATLPGTWTDAPFGGGLAVRITGTYQFFLPALLRFGGPTYTVNVTAITNSEAN